AYIVLGGVDAENVAAYDASRLEIREQSNGLHAVYDKQRSRWYFAFFRAGSYRSRELAVSVDRPCLLMLSREGGKTVVDIASPEQVHEQINVEIARPGKSKPKQLTARFDIGQVTTAGATQHHTLR
ncbi:MAG: polysaccharide lyase beta-sandwich domain-containing protein, partial [Rikenellaceae bacterium]|nr:polysaccharide lyase beta-sandwich domain-containing protein [Rikenellaceae bacterium]